MLLSFSSSVILLLAEHQLTRIVITFGGGDPPPSSWILPWETEKDLWHMPHRPSSFLLSLRVSVTIAFSLAPRSLVPSALAASKV